MGANTGIEWADHTFNPWIGCQAVSAACDHCYAETLVNGRMGGDFATRRRTSARNWRLPLKWNRDAEIAGRPARVFCASLADVFDNQADPAWRCDLWDLIWQTPWLTWMLLTKRPMNIAKMLPTKAAGALADWGDGWPTVWLGTTVENQEEADRRIPHLLAVPARRRFVSCEPLLGPVGLKQWFRNDYPGGVYYSPNGLHWVISGGESGPEARPSHPDWHRALRDQCARAGVAYFFKQWGDWAPASTEFDGTHWVGINGGMRPKGCGVWATDADMRRIGKKAAGGMLDGQLHRDFPHA